MLHPKMKAFAHKATHTTHRMNEISHWWYCLLVFLNQHEFVILVAGGMAALGILGVVFDGVDMMLASASESVEDVENVS